MGVLMQVTTTSLLPCPPQQAPHGTADNDAVGLWSTQDPDPDPQLAAHSNTFCLPLPAVTNSNLQRVSFPACACASATCTCTCTHIRTRFCNNGGERPSCSLVSFPELSGPLPCACHALPLRFLPSRKSYHTLPSLDHTTCPVPGPAIDHCQVVLTPSNPAGPLRLNYPFRQPAFP